MYIYRQVTAIQREQKERKNGNGNGNTSGAKPIEFWQKEFREAVVEGFTYAVKPILDNQTEILRNLRESQQDIAAGIIKLGTIAEMKR